jgi:histone H1/5
VTNCDWPQFAEETYHIEVSGGNLYQLNRAITSGVAAGVFALPKGPSGKVKLAPKKKPASDDEVR